MPSEKVSKQELGRSLNELYVVFTGFPNIDRVKKEETGTLEEIFQCYLKLIEKMPEDGGVVRESTAETTQLRLKLASFITELSGQLAALDRLLFLGDATSRESFDRKLTALCGARDNLHAACRDVLENTDRVWSRGS